MPLLKKSFKIIFGCVLPTVSLFSLAWVLVLGFFWHFYMQLSFHSADFVRFCHKHRLRFPPICFSFGLLCLFFKPLTFLSWRFDGFPGLRICFPFYNFPMLHVLAPTFRHSWLATTNIFCHTLGWISFLKMFYNSSLDKSVLLRPCFLLGPTAR